MIQNALPIAVKNPLARIPVFHSPKSTVSESIANGIEHAIPCPKEAIIQKTIINSILVPTKKIPICPPATKIKPKIIVPYLLNLFTNNGIEIIPIT